MEQTDALLGQEGALEDNPLAENQNTSTTNSTMSMETLLAKEGLSLEFPEAGEIRTGTIASISPTQILVSIGTKSEGVLTGRELETIPEEDREAFEIGQEIPVYVLNPEDPNGNVILSYNRAQEQLGWDMVEAMCEKDETYEGEIEGFNKGGLIVPVHGLRGFVPASQVSILRRSMATGDTPDQRWGKMVGEEISVRVIEVDRRRRRLILSERAANQETRQSIKERVLDELDEGETRTGRVTSLADFGAFVNINGADGLVHLSEISWERVDHPSDVLEVGQEVKVKVISVDKEKKRIGLSIRQLLDDPWKKRIEKFRVGQLVEGVITRLTKFGAFARLEGDVEGLIHISEISEQRIEHPKEVLKDGDVVNLRIIRIEPDLRRIGLSLRKVDSPAYADQDFKALSAELTFEEVEEEPVEAEEIAEVEVASETEDQAEMEVASEMVDETEAEVTSEMVDETEVEVPSETVDEAEVEVPSETEDDAETGETGTEEAQA